jgi:sugar O-acyltransferase (sialic acid O-acetyltransferase NeuD family)
MNNTLAIIGAGFLGQQIAHFAVNDNHYKNVVFFDDSTTLTSINGFKILGNTKSIITSFYKKEFQHVIIGIGYKHLEIREQFYKSLHQIIPFAKIIHSSCWIDNSASINEGCVLYPQCIIDANVILECNSIINLGCTISHDSQVGAHSFLAPRSAIAGFVKIGKSSFLGINSTIVDNVFIKENTRIGAGSVVIGDILTSGIYVGNPARLIKK